MINESIVYNETWIIDEIQKSSDEVLLKQLNPGLFEKRVISKITKYITENTKRRKHRRYIIKMIKRECKDFIESRQDNKVYNFSSIYEKDEDGNEQYFEPPDVLADVEDEIMAKEMAALLAQDSRSEIILDAWLLGNTNDTEVSRILADTLGGNSKSHRIYIQRFKKQCREKLIDVA